MRLRPALVSVGLAAVSIIVLAMGTQVSATSGQAFLAGGDKGLYLVREDETGLTQAPVWTDGSVRKLIPAYPGWYALSSRGILGISHEGDIAYISESMGKKTLLLKDSTGAFSPMSVAEDLRDIASDPSAPGRLAACTSTEVLLGLSHGGGWE